MTWSIAVIKAVIARVNSWFNFYLVIKGQLLVLLLQYSTSFNETSVLLMTAPTVMFLAIPPVAIGFSEVKPFQAKVIIDAENAHKANIVVCRLVGFWYAELCHHRLGDQICFVTEKQSADGEDLTRPRFVVAYFQNEILAIRGR